MYLVVESMLAHMFLIYYDGFVAAAAVVAADAGGMVGVDVVIVAVCRWTSVDLAAKFLSGI